MRVGSLPLGFVPWIGRFVKSRLMGLMKLEISVLSISCKCKCFDSSKQIEAESALQLQCERFSWTLI